MILSIHQICLQCKKYDRRTCFLNVKGSSYLKVHIFLKKIYILYLHNGAAGNLQFNRSSDLGTGVHISNVSADHQLQLRNSLSTGVTGIQHELAGVVRANAGVRGSDRAYYITMGSTPGGLAVDALSISQNSELYIPQLEADEVSAVAGFKIPLVNLNAPDKASSVKSISLSLHNCFKLVFTPLVL